MRKRLVTIATFDRLVLVRLVKNALDEAGILTIVTNRTRAAKDEDLPSASNEMSVQVLEKDAERAIATLAESFQSSRSKQRVSEEEAASVLLLGTMLFRNSHWL